MMEKCFFLMTLVISTAVAIPIIDQQQTPTKEDFCALFAQQVEQIQMNKTDVNTRLLYFVDHAFNIFVDSSRKKIDAAFKRILASDEYKNDGKKRAWHILRAADSSIQKLQSSMVQSFLEHNEMGLLNINKRVSYVCHQRREIFDIFTFKTVNNILMFSKDLSSIKPDGRCDEVIKNFFTSMEISDLGKSYSLSYQPHVQKTLSEYDDITKEFDNGLTRELVAMGLFLMDNVIAIDAAILVETFGDDLIVLGKVTDSDAALNSDLGQQMHGYCSETFVLIDLWRNVTLRKLNAAQSMKNPASN